MADIPEHLLKRSRDAKARAGGESEEAPAVEDRGSPEPDEAEAPAGEAPETTSDETEEVAVEEPVGQELEPAPAPAPAEVAPATAAKVYAPASQPTGVARGYRGARVPAWLIPVYIAVPLLMIALTFSIVNALEEEANNSSSTGPDGAAIYTKQCAACHGPEGGGGVGPALANVGKVFPDFKTMYEWVLNVAAETNGPYGEGGQGNNGEGARTGAMPAFEGTLSPEEIYAVVAHEREVYGGEDPSTFPPIEEYGGTAAGGSG